MKDNLEIVKEQHLTLKIFSVDFHQCVFVFVWSLSRLSSSQNLILRSVVSINDDCPLDRNFLVIYVLSTYFLFSHPLETDGKLHLALLFRVF